MKFILQIGSGRPSAALATAVLVGMVSASSAGLAAPGACASESAAPGARPEERAELIMGTIARVAIFDGDRGPATFDAAFARLRRVDASMSLYRPDSDVVRLNAHAAVHAEPVPRDLFDLLARARAISAATDGAFDVTVLPLLRAWGAYPELRYLPSSNPAAVGFEGMQLDATARTVRFRLPGMAVDLGGVAKGFALDRAREALAARGVRSARLDLGGNLALLGVGPGGTWRVAVRDPVEPTRACGVLVLAAGSAVATSANYARDFAREGWRAPSHVYDPRTRRPVLARVAVTVWAPDAATADALSTALLVLGPTEAVPVLARMPEVGALFVGGGPIDRVTLLGARPLAWCEGGGERDARRGES
jgi:FAD:protein FMN transferase